jgi:hypothetical protein
MSNQVYYVLARVGADSIGLYVESPDFDSAYNVAQERIAQRYKGPFTVQALQAVAVAMINPSALYSVRKVSSMVTAIWTSRDRSPKKESSRGLLLILADFRAR